MPSFKGTIIIFTEYSQSSTLSTVLYIFLTLKFAARQFCQRSFFHRISEHQSPWNKLLCSIYQLHCGIKVYEKNSLASIFKWLVAWKRHLPRSKFSYENLFPSPTLSYTITKKKLLRVLKLLRVFIEMVLRFHSDSVLFRFLSDRVLLRVLRDKVLFASPVIGSSSRSSVTDSSLGSSVFFSRMPLFFYENVVLLF